MNSAGLKKLDYKGVLYKKGVRIQIIAVVLRQYSSFGFHLMANLLIFFPVLLHQRDR